MSRKLASVVEIATCDPIPDTDRLSVATMVGKGWKIVTGRDEYKPGDRAVYFEIDSYLPADDPRYEFLRERCLRKFVSKSGQVLKEGLKIKTCKLRGVISQGLLMPIDQFKEITDRITSDDKGVYLKRDPESEGMDITLEPLVGADVTKILKVEHYDEVAEALRPASGGNPVSADAMGKFPSEFIPKTDEERIQNLGDYFEKMKGRAFEVTEKNDGSSVTVFLSAEVDPENPFGVCSRNLRLKPKMESGATPVPWQVAEKYGLREKLAKANAMSHTELAFQGELVGPGVNGNRDLYTEFEWHVFRIWDIKNQWFLMPGHAQDLCEDLGIPYVPVVNKFMKVFDEITSMDEMLKFAEGKTARGHEREGLVFKSCDDGPFVSFKAVSNRYLLKQKD
jgi:RNA ligase (TIGR02306 family)